MNSKPVVLDYPDADLTLYPGWLTEPLATQWQRQIVAQTAWQQPVLKLFGKEHPTPRLVAWHGDEGASYRYSGHTHQPMPWTSVLEAMRERLQATINHPLNSVLLNLYRDGRDSMGWHSDDEPELGTQPVIASVSLGASRRLDLRRKGQKRIEHSVQLEHGSLLVMRGPTQHHWQHQVAKTQRCNTPRLNLTFRLINSPL
ncbi:alpha-ketoglutarate-dependent dioxygenase AlkB family protein [Pseudomonas sp. TTU2014-080ASC]|uniref:alpha-ketoglutarate-dependent dioxygenase AlkB family protein n=1 Tax=Pseudomonas sp. TTU2014-080ASC TaxID=1729724 RepID=UPI0007185EDC|nr:alpha-ketoglutarate-dependent dioxygenase AlkB [Pseudomonas sp. TTU2014-080ASC]KRW62272.1 DNA repair protein [Pseudomonas sp. TTU2014-080ASC]